MPESLTDELENAAFIREEIYNMDSAPFVETVWQDIRYSLRTLRFSPRPPF